ncbi:phosphoesterase [Cohnella pontilimi]|uniref:Phosphoesterase n=1 Tax=Cohnella pontilimi TaxID=2564100 RepID=A0A4U0FEE4_9BACL|nr:CehA/McbA family metallohydrolase [Cohnella pontilimi]TJY43313.1 phosphoesterase [Cohnella pontilimi]
MQMTSTEIREQNHLLIIQQIHISKEEERTYPEVPFTVSGPVERIEVRYTYERSGGGTVVDIGLRSPERIVGWSGGARDSFLVGLEKATPGYLAGPIAEGDWAVMLGAYRIPAAGCSIRLEIQLVYKHSRWMKGDLHTHSVHSDGTYAIYEAISICKEKGFSFLALTDHNTASQNRTTFAAEEQLVLIPGVELTNYKGHANLLGHPDALDDFRVLTSEQAASALRKAAEQGAFVSLNHPFCTDCPWEFGFDVPYDAIEVWNGPWRPINAAAVKWWQEQLSTGLQITAIGGSDTHSPHPYVKHGRPTTYVLAESETTGGILDGLRRGRVILSCDSDDTFIDLAAGGAGIGDMLTVPETQHLELTMKVRHANGDRVLLWSDRGVEREWTAEGDVDYVFQVAADRKFYRAESYRFIPEWKQEFMTCLTNPIYLCKP